MAQEWVANPPVNLSSLAGAADGVAKPYRTFDELVDSLKLNRPPRVAVVAAASREVLMGVHLAMQRGLIFPVLVGNVPEIRAIALDIGMDLARTDVVDEPHEEEAVRRSIGLVQRGDVQMLMKGRVHTHVMLRAILQRESTLRTGQLVSLVIVFQLPGMQRLMLLTDPAVNIKPSLDDKVQICRNAIKVAHALGIAVPRVALIAASEAPRADLPSAVEAACLAHMAERDAFGRAIVDGPMQLDAAVSAYVASEKGHSGPVAGSADILVLPDIEAANVLVKALTYFAGADVAGTIVGARVPIVMQSRVEDPPGRLRSIALAVLMYRQMAPCSQHRQ